MGTVGRVDRLVDLAVRSVWSMQVAEKREIQPGGGERRAATRLRDADWQYGKGAGDGWGIEEASERKGCVSGDG
jgi:hypothetical protein